MTDIKITEALKAIEQFKQDVVTFRSLYGTFMPMIEKELAGSKLSSVVEDLNNANKKLEKHLY